MARHRTYRLEFIGQAAPEYLAGETLRGRAMCHDISRDLTLAWVAEFEAGAFDEKAEAPDSLRQREAKIGALERLVGRQALEIEFLKGAQENPHRPGSARIGDLRSHGLFAARGGALIGVPRSGKCDAPAVTTDETELVARVQAICDEFETCGHRPVRAALRHQGVVVNSKKVRRRLCNEPLDRCATRHRTRGGHPIATRAPGVRASFGSRWTMDFRSASQATRPTRAGRFDEAARRPLRQRPSESFIKTLKFEAVYLMDHETFDDVTTDLSGIIDTVQHPHASIRDGIPGSGAMSLVQFDAQHARHPARPQRDPVDSPGRTP